MAHFTLKLMQNFAELVTFYLKEVFIIPWGDFYLQAPLIINAYLTFFLKKKKQTVFLLIIFS